MLQILTRTRTSINSFLCRRYWTIENVRRQSIDVVVPGTTTRDTRRSTTGGIIQAEHTRTLIGHHVPVHRTGVIHNNQYVRLGRDSIFQWNVCKVHIKFDLTCRWSGWWRRRRRNINRHDHFIRSNRPGIVITNREGNLPHKGRIRCKRERSIWATVKRRRNKRIRNIVVGNGEIITIGIKSQINQTTFSDNIEGIALEDIKGWRNGRFRWRIYIGYSDSYPRCRDIAITVLNGVVKEVDAVKALFREVVDSVTHNLNPTIGLKLTNTQTGQSFGWGGLSGIGEGTRFSQVKINTG